MTKTYLILNNDNWEYMTIVIIFEIFIEYNDCISVFVFLAKCLPSNRANVRHHHSLSLPTAGRRPLFMCTIWLGPHLAASIPDQQYLQTCLTKRIYDLNF